MPPTTNECVPLYEPASRVTMKAAGAISGRRLVVKDTVAKALTGVCASAIQAATLGLKCAGVAAYDAASTEEFTVIRQGVVPIDAGATVTTGDTVMVDSTGRVITWVWAANGANFQVGVAWTDATVGLPCYVALSL